MDSDTHQRRSTVFGKTAQAYARWRPTYPDEAVDWLLPTGARHVADLGAGTGKLTGSLLRRGLVVDAVEPDAAMLAVLGSEHPAARRHLAGADALPLEEGSVDAVLVGQAWHWFPHERAAEQIRRVLRPGGWAGLVWNTATRTDGWSEAVARLDPDPAHRVGWAPDEEPHVPGLPTAELETTTFPWVWQVTADHVRAHLGTMSVFAVMDEGERTAVLDQAHAIVQDACRRAGTATVPWPHTARCVRWRPGAGT